MPISSGARRRRASASGARGWDGGWRGGPVTRVAADAGIPPRRKAIYATRMANSRWSVRVHRLAPGLYYPWARAVSAVYHALAYSRGWMGKVADRIWPPAAEG